MKPFLFILLIAVPFMLRSQQKHDHNWVIGVKNGGGNLLSFTDDSLQITHLPQFDMTLEAANTSMSDEIGNLAFYSNGCFVANQLHEQMDNGDNLNPGEMQQVWCPTGGNPVSQAIMSLPDPGNPERYYIFHEGMNSWFPPSGSDFAPFHLYYSIVDMTEGGLGKVTVKNEVALTDTLFRGFLSAVRHGNGRDWWVLVPKHNSNCFFKVLLSPDGVDSVGVQCIGEPWGQFEDISGQAVFSPNGKKYIIYQTCHGLDIFDFDRCSGELSNDIHIPIESDSCAVGGAAISSNSRFVYVTTRINVYQFDLLAGDIGNSKTLVGTWNGTPIPGQIQFFFLSQLAPNNKIYIGPSDDEGVVYSLHVINQPDSLGAACDLVRHGVELPGPIFSSLPSFPHFGLGALEGGACDTIVSAAVSLQENGGLHIYPNPTAGHITVESTNPDKKVNVRIFDLLGRLRKESPLYWERNNIDLSDLEDGVYLLQLYSGDSYFTQIIIKKE